MRKLARMRGGQFAFLTAESSRRMFLNACKAKRELFYVYLLMDYLCRCRKYLGENRFDIETAKQFLDQLDPEEESRSYGRSKIEKIWLKYRRSAPLIFAFYPFLERGLRKEERSLEGIIGFIAKLAFKEARLKRLLGKAAYAAGMAELRVHNIRFQEFKQIDQVEPRLPPFSDTEKALISNIDRGADIAEQYDPMKKSPAARR